MQTYTCYSQAIYCLTCLTLKKKYSRVIKISHHLITQGVQTNQLLTILSYAYMEIGEHSKAIDTLQGRAGALVETALAQYKTYMEKYQSANESLANLTQKPTILSLIKANNDLLLNRSHEFVIEFIGNQQIQFIYEKTSPQLLKEINGITGKYLQIKELKKDAPQQFKARSQQIIGEYEQIIKHRKLELWLKNNLQSYVKFLREVA